MSEKSQEQKPEVKETQDGGVEVSLEKEEQDTPEVIQEDKPKEEPRQDPFKNKVYAQDRIISKLQKEIEELRSEKLRTQPEPEPVMDDLDKLAQTDWKAAVSKLAEEKARQIYSKEQQKIQEQSIAMQNQQLLQVNEQKVLGKYPELNDSSSEHSQIWFEVLNQNPRWRNLPDGPILVMREMEDVLRSKGYDIDGSKTKAVENERQRLANAQATTLESPRATPSNKVVLSKEQRDFCDANGLSYEEYARTLKRTGERGLEL